jgi:Spy/CpxP family protein refolding chaperone
MKNHLSRSLPLLAAVALLLVLSPASVLRAQPPAGGPGGPGGPDGARGMGPGGPGFMLPRIARALDLSEGQVEQTRALLEDLAGTVEPLREQGRTLRQEIEDLLAADAPDATAIGEKVIEGHALREQGRAAWDEFQTAFEALLTPAQKERWELLKDIRAFLGGPHDGPRGAQRGMGGGPGGQA